MPTRRRAYSAFGAVGVVAAFASLLAQSPQQPTPAAPAPPVFRAGTSLVPVDVRVLDKQGKPVTDLTPADFTVLENGAQQQIRHFVTQSLTPIAPAPGAAPDARLEHRVSQVVDLTPQNHRVFLLVLARGRLDGPANGVDGLVHLVRDRLLPQDRVAVLAWNRATDFTTDHAQIVDLLDRFKQTHNKIESELQQYFSGLVWLYGNGDIPSTIQRDIDAVVTGPNAAAMRTIPPGTVPDATRIEDDTRRTVDAFQAPASDTISQALTTNLGMTFDQFIQSSVQTGQDLGNLYAGIAYLQQIEGEKHLLWVSETGLMTERYEDDQTLARSASDARIVLDIIRTGGTALADPGAAEARRAPSAIQISRANLANLQPSATSRTLAELTGGRFDANRFPNASVDADYISEASSFQYLLGYYPSNGNWDGRYRNITVRVNRPDVTVMYRHGYFARTDVAPLDARAALTYSRVTTAARYAKPIPDIKLTATAAPKAGNAATVVVNLTLDISRIAFTKTNGRNVASVELAVFCLDNRQKAVGDAWKTIDLNLPADRYQQLLKDGVTTTIEIPVTAPCESAKIVAYAYDVDRVGSTNVKIAR